jgi:hypothetical protein
MGKKLVITLDETTTSNYLKLVSKTTEAHVDEGCEPPGAMLMIDISPIDIFACEVFLGNSDIGEASVELKDD